MKIKSGLLIGMLLPCLLAPAQAQVDPAVSSSTAAGGASVLVHGVILTKDGVAIFETSPPDQAQANCARRAKWSLSVKNKQQQAMLTRLIIARSSKVPVSIRGLGKCLSVKDAETISSVDALVDSAADSSASTVTTTNSGSGN